MTAVQLTWKVKFIIKINVYIVVKVSTKLQTNSYTVQILAGKNKKEQKATYQCKHRKLICDEVLIVHDTENVLLG